MKLVSILLPVHNGLQHTKKCLETLERMVIEPVFTSVRFHIVVIDDGSIDGTGEWISKHYPDLSLLRGDGNLWWSGGVNLGAEYSLHNLQSDYLLLWNNDVIPGNDYFENLERIMDSLEEKDVVGSKIFRLENDLIWSHGGIFDPVTGKKYLLGYNKPDSERFLTTTEVDWLPGMGTLIPSSLIGEIGFWDDKLFPQYHGDSDFTYRAKKAGYRILVFPELKLWNDKTTSGLKHNDSFLGLYRALTDIRSNSNIKKNLAFYRRHASSWRAYRAVAREYGLMIGGFLKWKLLSLFGMKRNSANK